MPMYKYLGLTVWVSVPVWAWCVYVSVVHKHWMPCTSHCAPDRNECIISIDLFSFFAAAFFHFFTIIRNQFKTIFQPTGPLFLIHLSYASSSFRIYFWHYFFCSMPFVLCKGRSLLCPPSLLSPSTKCIKNRLLLFRFINISVCFFRCFVVFEHDLSMSLSVM